VGAAASANQEDTVSNETPWGDQKPTIEEYVEHHKSTQSKDEILHLANVELELGLDDGLTKGDLLVAIHGRLYSEPVEDDAPEEEAEKEAKEPVEKPEPEAKPIRLEDLPGCDLRDAIYDIDAPTKRELVAHGYAPSSASRIIVKFEELRRALVEGHIVPDGKRIEFRPGFKLTSRQSGTYWCIGKPFAPGKSQSVALDELTAAHLLEIETKRDKTMIVEEIEIETEVEIDDEA